MNPPKTLIVKVIPRAKRNEVVEKNGQFIVRVTAPAQDGKANEAVRKYLAKYLDISPSRLRIVRGITSRHKHIEQT